MCSTKKTLPGYCRSLVEWVFLTKDPHWESFSRHHVLWWLLMVTFLVDKCLQNQKQGIFLIHILKEKLIFYSSLINLIGYIKAWRIKIMPLVWKSQMLNFSPNLKKCQFVKSSQQTWSGLSPCSPTTVADYWQINISDG